MCVCVCVRACVEGGGGGVEVCIKLVDWTLHNLRMIYIQLILYIMNPNHNLLLKIMSMHKIMPHLNIRTYINSSIAKQASSNIISTFPKSVL